MISVPRPVRISVHHDQLNIEEIIVSSAIRLGKGGRARLAMLVINHQVAMRGRIFCNPRASSIVRLWVRS